MTVTRRLLWATILPRHHQTHHCVARQFALASDLGDVTWRNPSHLGPFQFHVEGSRETFEAERFEEMDGRHRFEVRVLRVAG